MKHSQKFQLSSEVVSTIRNHYNQLKLLVKYSKKLPEGLPDESIFKSDYISNYNTLYNYCVKITGSLEEKHWHFEGSLIRESDYDDSDKLTRLFIEDLHDYAAVDVEDLFDQIDRVKSKFVKKPIYEDSFKADVLAVIEPIIRIFEEANQGVK